MTPLHWAAQNDFEKGVKILIEKGANVDLQNEVFLIFDFFFFYVFFDVFLLIWLFGFSKTRINSC